jgi:hypothetical protein
MRSSSSLESEQLDSNSHIELAVELLVELQASSSPEDSSLSSSGATRLESRITVLRILLLRIASRPDHGLRGMHAEPDNRESCQKVPRRLYQKCRSFLAKYP